MLGLLGLLFLPLFFVFFRIVLMAMFVDGLLPDGVVVDVPPLIMRLFDVFGASHFALLLSLLALVIIVGLFVDLGRAIRC